MNQNNNSSLSKLTIGVRRPDWICSNAYQEVILVRDASPSMDGQKASDASAASQDLVVELAEPGNKDGFRVAIVNFSGDAEVVHDMAKATALKGGVKTLTADNGGGTNITAGLDAAFELIKKGEGIAAPGVFRLRPVVLLFSDGQHNTGPAPAAAAARLKCLADIVTVGYGSDADELELKALATSEQHYYRCVSGKDLRRFLAAVGATLTATMSARVNATMSLGQMQQ